MLIFVETSLASCQKLFFIELLFHFIANDDSEYKKILFFYKDDWI